MKIYKQKDDNSKFLPKRRQLSQAPSQEYVFKPSIRILNQDLDANSKK